MQADHHLHPRRMAGFTLLELMIVLAVVAILASIAVPAWQDQVRRSRRSDAMEALATLQQAQERWRGGNPSYSDDLADLNVPANSPDGLYTLSIRSADAAGYVIEAAAATGSSQAADEGCTTLTVTSAAGSLTTGPDGCWKQ